MARYSKKAVQEMLDRSGDTLDNSTKRYFIAIMEDTLPNYYLEILVDFRENYSDQLPEPDLPFDHPDYVFYRLEFRDQNPNMKCRANVILRIALNLGGVISDGVVNDNSIVDLVKEFKEKDWNAFKGAKGEYWTTQDEINYINATLDEVISQIEKKYDL